MESYTKSQNLHVFFSSQYGSVMDFCDHGNEPLGFITYKEILDYLSHITASVIILNSIWANNNEGTEFWNVKLKLSLLFS